jgi:hypothetical protein
MTLFEFIADSHNALFAGALALMLFIALLEGVSTLLGAGLSNIIDTLLPDTEIDLSIPDTSSSALSRLLGWLHVGRVPILVIVVIFLTAFGLIGYGIQSLLLGLSGMLWPGWMVAIGAFFGALPVVRVISGAIRKIIPQDESSAISEENYIGHIAIITLGTAKYGYPAEAKLTDQYGQTHYLMVEPESQEHEFTQGDNVLVVARKANRFVVIENIHTALTDENTKESYDI